MTPGKLLRGIESGLSPLCVAAGGALDVSESPDDTMEMLKVGPRRWRLILQYGGFNTVDTYGTCQDETIILVVQAAKRLLAQHGDSIHRPSNPSRTPILDLVAQVISWARGLRFVDVDETTGTETDALDVDKFGLVPQDGGWLQGENNTTRNFEITFSIGTAWDGFWMPSGTVAR